MNEQQQRSPVKLSQVMAAFLYIGIAGYGGGPAIVGLIQRMLVERKRWLAQQEFLTGLSLAQMLPGAMVVDTVTYIGYTLSGAWGAVLAPAVFLLPSFVLVTAMSALYFSYGELPIFHALFTGLGAIVVALIANAVLIMARPAIRDFRAVLLALAGFIAFELHVYILIIAALAAVAGWLAYGRLPVASTETGAEARKPTTSAFWIGWGAVALLVAALLVVFRQTLVTQATLAIFRVGVLSFGGGFAAIPLFQHEAVDATKWLSMPEFRAGIALGQVTPGPVLITATFIGYAVLRQFGLWAGVLGAFLGTVAAFTPGIAAMLLVAHAHERVRHLGWLQAMVRGVVAAYIGLLVKVLIDLGRGSIIDWRTAALAAAALLVLLVLKKDPLWVIIGGAAVSVPLFMR